MMRRDWIHWITSARQPETLALRITVATSLRDVLGSARGTRAGFGGPPKRTSLVKILQKETKIAKELQSWTSLLIPSDIR
jgi:hypothetical protein